MAGPKKTTCSICGEKVLKSQTYHVGDGKRACKKHEGVTEQAHAAQDKIKKDNKKAEEARQATIKRSKEKHTFNFEDAAKWANETCWFCGKKGRPLSELFTRQLVALEKLKLKGNFSAFFNNPAAVVREAGFPEGTIFLNRIVIPDERRKEIIGKVRGGFDKQGCADMAGFVLSCPHCAKKLGLQFMPDAPKVDLKTLAVFGSLYDKELGPSVRLTAGVEILEEEEQKKKAAPFN